MIECGRNTPRGGHNTPRGGPRKGQKTRAGRLSVEAPVRPKRVEIPSRKAGERRLSGAPKRGGALQQTERVEIPSRRAGERRAGRLTLEAPVRPKRVAARVEIPSRKAGETVERSA